jgi:hypothetical protein
MMYDYLMTLTTIDRSASAQSIQCAESCLSLSLSLSFSFSYHLPIFISEDDRISLSHCREHRTSLACHCSSSIRTCSEMRPIAQAVNTSSSVRLALEKETQIVSSLVLIIHLPHDSTEFLIAILVEHIHLCSICRSNAYERINNDYAC